MITKTIAVAALSLTLVACEGAGPKQTGGGLIGAIGGAAIGSQFGSGTGQIAAIAAGTLLGAFVGSEIGKGLDANDRAQLQQAQYRAYAAPVGEQIAWNNPASGNSGTIVPTREGRRSDGAYCREFQNNVVIGGKREEAYGTACRQPDGSWKIVQ
jgi:surface antigen